MRARWLLVACFFFINVVAALAAGRWVAAGLCAVLAFCILLVGFVDAAAIREEHPSVPAAPRDPEAVEAAVAALAELVALKDGPKGTAYEAAKPLAWQKGREALSLLAVDERAGGGAR